MITQGRMEIERIERWEEWTESIPYLQFAEKWQVKIIPPIVGVMARFTVRYNDKQLSIYLDCHEALGSVGKGRPYWELYPYKDDIARFEMSNTKGLIDAIKEEFSVKPYDSSDCCR